MALQHALLKRVKRWHQQFQRLQRSASPKNVHQFRIACRELLVCAELFNNLAPAKHWQPQVENALHSLSRLRDLQQLHDRLHTSNAMTDSSIDTALETPLRKALMRWQRAAPDLRTRRCKRALGRIEKALSGTSCPPEILQSAWHKEWKKALRRVRKSMLVLDANDPTSLHRLRIRYKQLRYLLELQLDSGNALPVSEAKLRKWQDDLGHAGDYGVMAHYARKLKLPRHLHSKYQRLATRHARSCADRHSALSAYLLRLERTVNTQLN